MTMPPRITTYTDRENRIVLVAGLGGFFYDEARHGMSDSTALLCWLGASVFVCIVLAFARACERRVAGWFGWPTPLR